jgi:hypothetical protein
MTETHASSRATDVWPSWRAGGTKDAILAFVQSVTEPGERFVRAADRIATFDNDRTLWCERPMYVQADFIRRRWAAMIAAHPTLRDRQPFKAVAEKDMKWLGSLLDHVPDLVAGVSEAFGGMTTEAFEQEAREFFPSAVHPTLHVAYTRVAYQPMRELLDLLEANDFRTFICSADGRDVVRVVSEDLYGLARECVIGSSAPVEFKNRTLTRTAGIEQPVDDGPGKPVHIWARTGRLPLFAARNADGDIEMLSLARFALLVHHDDAAREFAYDAGAEHALAAAKAGDWTVASIERDFATVFATQTGAR